MAFDRIFIDDVRRATHAAETIGAYVELKKSGSRLRGRCPFHKEKTPSFYVDDTLGLYKCFGCGKGGDIFTFVMEMEHLTFNEAVEHLARKAGITPPRSRREASGPGRREIEEVLESANKLFQAQLRSRADRAVRYLADRGFDEALLQRWGIGWAPGGSVASNRLRKDFPMELLVAAGVTIVREDRAFDFFRERIIIPIRDTTGRIVGFSGRAMGDGQPKYINTKETPYFQKSRLLYGFSRARKEVVRRGEWMVVEGFFDCIRLVEAGFANAAATMGTALTRDHGAILKRAASRVLLCFDGDEAGRKASLAALANLLPHDMEVDLLFLPPGKDPDDIIRDEGGEGFARLIESGRRSFFDYVCVEALGSGLSGLTPAEKSRRIEMITGILSHISDDLTRYEYLRELGSRTGIPIPMLSRRIGRKGAASSGQREVRDLPGMEWAFFAMLLTDRELQQRFGAELQADLFTDPELKHLAELFLDLLRSRKEGVDILDFKTHLIERGGNIALLSEVAFADYGSNTAETYFLHLEEKRLSRLLREVQTGLQGAEGKRVVQLLKEKQNITSLLMDIRKRRG